MFPTDSDYYSLFTLHLTNSLHLQWLALKVFILLSCNFFLIAIHTLLSITNSKKYFYFLPENNVILDALADKIRIKHPFLVAGRKFHCNWLPYFLQILKCLPWFFKNKNYAGNGRYYAAWSKRHLSTDPEQF